MIYIYICICMRTYTYVYNIRAHALAVWVLWLTISSQQIMAPTTTDSHTTLYYRNQNKVQISSE